MKYRYAHVAVGGTFDRLHVGHKRILDIAFASASHVTIAITTADMHLSKQLPDVILSFPERKKDVQSYIISKGWKDRATFEKLTDVFGSAIKDSTVDSIVVTDDVIDNAREINRIRSEHGMSKLHFLAVPFVHDTEDGVVTSSRIRRGEINRDGMVYISMLKTKSVYRATEEVKRILRKPVGKVLPGDKDDIYQVCKLLKSEIKVTDEKWLITVGDIVTKTLHGSGLVPRLSIIDNKTRRKTLDDGLNHVEGVERVGSFKNRPGTINSDVCVCLNDSIRRSLDTGKAIQMQIIGEEDMLALPAIILAPLGSFVLYGQFDVGVVAVEVTEQMKEWGVSLIKMFETDFFLL